MALVLEESRLLTQAHLQISDLGEVKIHVEGVGSPSVIVREVRIRRVWLLLAVCRVHRGQRLRGEISVHLTLCLLLKRQTHKQSVS